jgi:hypothetical protein
MGRKAKACQEDRVVLIGVKGPVEGWLAVKAMLSLPTRFYDSQDDVCQNHDNQIREPYSK